MSIFHIEYRTYIPIFPQQKVLCTDRFKMQNIHVHKQHDKKLIIHFVHVGIEHLRNDSSCFVRLPFSLFLRFTIGNSNSIHL